MDRMWASKEAKDKKETGEEVETHRTKELENGLVRKKERDQMCSVGQNLRSTQRWSDSKKETGAGGWERGLVASHSQCMADSQGASRYLHFIPEAILRRLLRWGLSGGDVR